MCLTYRHYHQLTAQQSSLAQASCACKLPPSQNTTRQRCRSVEGNVHVANLLRAAFSTKAGRHCLLHAAGVSSTGCHCEQPSSPCLPSQLWPVLPAASQRAHHLVVHFWGHTLRLQRGEHLYGTAWTSCHLPSAGITQMTGGRMLLAAHICQASAPGAGPGSLCPSASGCAQHSALSAQA